jgi:major type 1 subunit fimbrin (pilin)
MKKLALSTIVAGALGLAAAGAYAGDGTITFNGALTATTCTINGNGTSAKNFTVQLPTVSTSLLTAAGNTAGTTSYSVALTGCTPVTAQSKASVFYEAGATVDPIDGRLITSGTTGNNVKLQLLNADGTPIKAGYSMDQQNLAWSSIASGAATMTYQVQYYATGATKAGPANSSVVYTINYQ